MLCFFLIKKVLYNLHYYKLFSVGQIKTCIFPFYEKKRDLPTDDDLITVTRIDLVAKICRISHQKPQLKRENDFLQQKSLKLSIKNSIHAKIWVHGIFSLVIRTN